MSHALPASLTLRRFVLIFSLCVAVLFRAAWGADAQTIVARAQLPPEFTPIGEIHFVEADGDPTTVEILAVRGDGWYSVGRPHCAGPWIDPREGANLHWLSVVTVVEIGGRSYWLVRDYSGAIVLRQMDVCK